MSVSREVIAKVNGVPTDKVKCANCISHSAFINDMLWCDAWDLNTRTKDFCSFFEPKEKENTK